MNYSERTLQGGFNRWLWKTSILFTRSGLNSLSCRGETLTENIAGEVLFIGKVFSLVII
jgi:hypothetical protein